MSRDCVHMHACVSAINLLLRIKLFYSKPYCRHNVRRLGLRVKENLVKRIRRTAHAHFLWFQSIDDRRFTTVIETDTQNASRLLLQAKPRCQSIKQTHSSVVTRRRMRNLLLRH